MRAAVDDLAAGVAPEIVAARFHNGVARAVVAVASVVRAASGLDTVALSGGVFQNHCSSSVQRTVSSRRAVRFLTHHPPRLLRFSEDRRWRPREATLRKSGG